MALPSFGVTEDERLRGIVKRKIPYEPARLAMSSDGIKIKKKENMEQTEYSLDSRKNYE